MRHTRRCSSRCFRPSQECGATPLPARTLSLRQPLSPSRAAPCVAINLDGRCSPHRRRRPRSHRRSRRVGTLQNHGPTAGSPLLRRRGPTLSTRSRSPSSTPLKIYRLRQCAFKLTASASAPATSRSDNLHPLSTSASPSFDVECDVRVRKICRLHLQRAFAGIAARRLRQRKKSSSNPTDGQASTLNREWGIGPGCSSPRVIPLRVPDWGAVLLLLFFLSVNPSLPRLVQAR
jgi:hypothetical protein